MSGASFQPNLLAILSGITRGWRKTVVRNDSLLIGYRSWQDTVLFTMVQDVSVHTLISFGSVSITLTDGRTIAFRGLSRSVAIAAGRWVRKAIESFAYAYLAEHSLELTALRKAVERATSAKKFIAFTEHQKLIRTCKPYASILTSGILSNLPVETRHDAEKIRDYLANSDQRRESANARFIAEETVACRELFDTIESSPLTIAQRRAALTAEDNTLVVAGAGSGKTSVIVAKIAYQLYRELIRPEEILSLAFSRAAATELQERFKKRLGLPVSASTFHALGLGIIGESTGRKPDVSILATDQAKLLRFVQETLERSFIDDDHLRTQLQRWLTIFFAPYKPSSAFAENTEYWEYLQNQNIRSLSGDLVKSYEECEIADFLHLNGVNFTYEAPYEHDTFTAERRQYKPDFRIGASGLYIEHFGIDRNGRTAPFVNQQEYAASMEWKRETHQRFGTRLIETYSWQQSEGNLLEALAEALEREGIELKPKPPGETLDALKALGRVSRLAMLITTFLNHQRSGQSSIEGLQTVASNSKQRIRNLVFLDIYQVVLDAYEQELAATNEIDFNDMINMATEAVSKGKFKPPWRMILIDEFQDISRSRAELIKALLREAAGAQLYVVGDDWQAIYRFAGADIAVMRHFGSEFGAQETVELNDNFRFGQTLANISSGFVRRNPSQTQREIRSQGDNSPGVVIVYRSNKSPAPLATALAAIAELAKEKKASVLMLGRYRHLEPDNMEALASAYSNLRVSYRTAHASKGLEADYVVIVDMVKGRLGFPSEIVDDPALELVLTDEDTYEDAEERRLFYVAMTRSRQTVFLLSDENESRFVRELAITRGVEIWGKAGSSGEHCPSCKRGYLVARTSRFGPFFGCSNFPYCEFKANRNNEAN
jgi:DNA helicase IV